MGMARGDFLLMTPSEFEAAARAWEEAHRAEQRSAWLRTRRLAAILIRPHVKRGIPEEELIPLPGDTPRRERKAQVPADAKVSEERIRAFRQELSTGTTGHPPLTF